MKGRHGAAERKPDDTADGQSSASPFQEALAANPSDLARDSEAVMGGPQREETQNAEAQKKAQAARSRNRGMLDEVTDGNVRSPLDRS